MNIRRLSYGLMFTLSAAWLAACGGEAPPPETPPAPTAEPAPPPPSATAEAAPPAPTATAVAEAPPPPKKKNSELIVGKWVQDFSGDVQTAADAEATKKAGKADKDGKKKAGLLAKAEEAVKQHTGETTADTHTEFMKGKPVSKHKYKILKEDGNTITVAGDGKDEVTKKDMSKLEVTLTLTDDNTITMKDPMAKDPAKAQTLVFKRQ